MEEKGTLNGWVVQKFRRNLNSGGIWSRGRNLNVEISLIESFVDLKMGLEFEIWLS